MSLILKIKNFFNGKDKPVNNIVNNAINKGFIKEGIKPVKNESYSAMSENIVQDVMISNDVYQDMLKAFNSLAKDNDTR